MKKYLIIFLIAFLGLVVAQDLTNPTTWYESPATLMAVISLVTPHLTRIITALAKDKLGTSGNLTRWIALCVALILGGVGGYFGLGFMAGVTGIKAALYGAVNVVIAYYGSQALLVNDRQQSERNAKNIEIERTKPEIKE
jgi:hypothetical protein